MSRLFGLCVSLPRLCLCICVHRVCLVSAHVWEFVYVASVLCPPVYVHLCATHSDEAVAAYDALVEGLDAARVALALLERQVLVPHRQQGEVRLRRYGAALAGYVYVCVVCDVCYTGANRFPLSVSVRAYGSWWPGVASPT